MREIVFCSSSAVNEPLLPRTNVSPVAKLAHKFPVINGKGLEAVVEAGVCTESGNFAITLMDCYFTFGVVVDRQDIPALVVCNLDEIAVVRVYVTVRLIANARSADRYRAAADTWPMDGHTRDVE